jgi:nicotinamide mononucleotide transporter
VTGQRILDALATIAPAEWLGVALALAYLLLAVRQHLACWVFAASSSAVFLWLFARAGLAMQAALQVFYIAMAGYGWYAWRGGLAAAQAARPVTRRAVVWHLSALAVIVLLSAVTGRLTGAKGDILHFASCWFRDCATAGEMENVPFSAVPYVDALVAWGSVFTTWLVARKVLENWLYWIALDLCAAALYWSQGLYATAALFVLYSAIAVQGYRSWRSSLGGAAVGAAAA